MSEGHGRYMPPVQKDQLTHDQLHTMHDRLGPSPPVSIVAWADESQTTLLVTGNGGQWRIATDGSYTETETSRLARA